jgi:ribose-phosphate pyrophosphokinase
MKKFFFCNARKRAYGFTYSKENAEKAVSKSDNSPDGETYVRILSDVRDKVILVCTLHQPDSKLLPLYSCQKQQRTRCTAGLSGRPYLSYMRQDSIFNPGEGVTSNYFAHLVSGFVDSLITIDPHLHRIKSLSEIYSQ